MLIKKISKREQTRREVQATSDWINLHELGAHDLPSEDCAMSHLAAKLTTLLSAKLGYTILSMQTYSFADEGTPRLTVTPLKNSEDPVIVRLTPKALAAARACDKAAHLQSNPDNLELFGASIMSDLPSKVFQAEIPSLSKTDRRALTQCTGLCFGSLGVSEAARLMLAFVTFREGPALPTTIAN